MSQHHSVESLIRRILLIEQHGTEEAADMILADEARQSAARVIRKRREEDRELAGTAKTLSGPREAGRATRERDTLLKLVIGMAMAGYSYDPNVARSGASADIAGDLEKLGIGLSDDTVRKWLKEAATGVLPATRRQT